MAKSTELTPKENRESELRKKLDIQERIIKNSLVLGRKHSLFIAAALWNIRHHKLYRADGFDTMCGYAREKGIAQRSLYDLLAKAKALTGLAFRTDTPLAERWLTQVHVDLLINAEKEKTRLSPTSCMRLLGDGEPVAPETDDATLDAALDAIEADEDIEALSIGFQSLAVARQTRRDKLPPNRLPHTEEEYKDAAMDAQSVASKLYEFWGTKEFKKGRTQQYFKLAYYTRLAYWMLDNGGIPGVQVVTYEAAMEMIREHASTPDQIPFYVFFALDIKEESSFASDENAIIPAK